MADIELKKKPSMDEEEQLVTKQRKDELKQEKKNEKDARRIFIQLTT